ncbi:hypothetical protein DEO72_LG7g1701 [Vigna unguiculata]|uniref:Uncharacterized protein n=1 Tax=Vigna unguiculata TaxID=3917 RepID=A0A4D6MI64_VIGUN|nr:hypothetical protein DEO72_LG7g1701 [Vigna unguiculata]
MQGRVRTRRIVSSEPLLADPEIEKTARRNNSATRRRAQAQQVDHHSYASDTLLSTSQNLDSFPKEEMAENPHGDGKGRERRTLEDYAAFTGHINFNSIARPTKKWLKSLMVMVKVVKDALWQIMQRSQSILT